MGWCDLGDLRQIVDNASRLRTTVIDVRATNAYYRAQANPERSIAYISDQARQFVRGINVGDIVVAADGERILGVAKVSGEYRFDPPVRARIREQRCLGRKVTFTAATHYVRVWRSGQVQPAIGIV
jgi:predicted Mrr-cat superfamily restriction endonuclease